MKAYNALQDDDGQKWEFSYEETQPYEERDGEFVALPTVVTDFRYRKDGDQEWLRLPPWADVAEAWKVTLCFFDEDEESGELTYWRVEPVVVS